MVLNTFTLLCDQSPELVSSCSSKVYAHYTATLRFNLLILSFDVQFLILMQANLPIFALACVFGVISKKIMTKSNVIKLSPVFSSSGFIIFALRFRSLIDAELIFVHGIR